MACRRGDREHGLGRLDFLPEDQVLIVWGELDPRDAHVHMRVDKDSAEGTAAGGLLDGGVEVDWAAVDGESACGAGLGVPGGCVCE